MKKINTIVVGLGNIGMMYDFHKNNKYFLTHVKSISANKNYNLLGAIDSDIAKISLFKQKYDLPAYKKIDDIKIFNKIDLVVVASPTETHFNIIKKVLLILKPKIILCEKPFTDDFFKASILIRLCKKNKTKLFINYIRNSLPVFDKIKKFIEIRKKTFFTAKVYFSGDILNNGSHYFIFFYKLFKDYFSYKLMNYKKTKRLDLVINYKNCKLLLNNIKNSYKEDKIILKNSNDSIVWNNSSRNVIFNKNKKIVKIVSNINKYQKYVYNEISRVFLYKKKSLLLVDASSAIKFLIFYKKIKYKL
jgi:hypothetical protein